MFYFISLYFNNLLQNYAARMHRHKSSDCFEYLPNPYLNQATQKNLPNFPTPKNPRIQISNSKKSFDHRRYLKSGVHPLTSQTQSQIVQLAAVSLYSPTKLFKEDSIYNKYHHLFL